MSPWKYVFALATAGALMLAVHPHWAAFYGVAAFSALAALDMIINGNRR